MNEIINQLLIIFVLILINGFFAAAEIAIITMRKSRTKELINKGSKTAEIIAELQEDPENFLATIQVGITLVSTAAAAFGGASLVEKVSPALNKLSIPFITEYSEGIAFFIVVILIAYFTIVLGELVPKSFALRFAEKISKIVSYPIKFFSIIFFIFIKILTTSSNIILAPFKDKTNFTEAKLSEEEIRYLIDEGRKIGSIEKAEHEILENVFDFGNLEVGKIIIPPNKMVAFDMDSPSIEIVEKIIESNYSRIPIYQGNIDNIIGIIYLKDVLKELAKKVSKKKINIKNLLKPAIFIPTTESLHDVLQKFKKQKIHMAVVVDEHGGVAGIVTLEDILEEIVGDISDEGDETSKDIIKQEDGNYLVEGGTAITDLNNRLKINLPEDQKYQSISGFLLDLIKRFPETDEKIIYKNLEFLIKEKTQKRIKKISIIKKSSV